MVRQLPERWALRIVACAAVRVPEPILFTPPMEMPMHRRTRSHLPGLLLALAGAMLSTLPVAAQASLWSFSYSGAGISASGSLTASDTPDGAGFRQVTGISGQRNGVAITGLTPTGTAIPGNEPFVVDNLLSGAATQLTGDGLGFSLADGSYANVFFASFLAPQGYLEYHSVAPFVAGVAGIEDSELPVAFSATLAGTVPEPGSLLLAALALSALAVGRGRAHRG